MKMVIRELGGPLTSLTSTEYACSEIDFLLSTHIYLA